MKHLVLFSKNESYLAYLCHMQTLLDTAVIVAQYADNTQNIYGKVGLCKVTA